MENPVKTTLAKLRQLDAAAAARALPQLDGIFIETDARGFQVLCEGKLVSGRFQNNIRIDRSTHTRGAGMTHAHVHGRKGDEYVIVNLDGSGSHGTKGKLHPADAERLRAQGFTIRDDLIVEWIETGFLWSALFEGR